MGCCLWYFPVGLLHDLLQVGTVEACMCRTTGPDAVQCFAMEHLHLCECTMKLPAYKLLWYEKILRYCFGFQIDVLEDVA